MSLISHSVDVCTYNSKYNKAEGGEKKSVNSQMFLTDTILLFTFVFSSKYVRLTLFKPQTAYVDNQRKLLCCSCSCYFSAQGREVVLHSITSDLSLIHNSVILSPHRCSSRCEEQSTFFTPVEEICWLQGPSHPYRWRQLHGLIRALVKLGRDMLEITWRHQNLSATVNVS